MWFVLCRLLVWLLQWCLTLLWPPGWLLLGYVTKFPMAVTNVFISLPLGRTYRTEEEWTPPRSNWVNFAATCSNNIMQNLGDLAE